MPVLAKNWIVLAEGLPGWISALPSFTLRSNQTPSATNLNIGNEGYISKGTIPAATDYIKKTYAIGGADYAWHYERCWRVSGTSLIYNAPQYTTSYYLQNEGAIDLNNDTKAISLMLPIGHNSLILFRSTGAHIVLNAADKRAIFQVSDFLQDAKLAAATYAVSVGGTVYFVQDSNLFSITAGGDITMLSAEIRGEVPTSALKADYDDQYIIMGDTLVYDIKGKRFFKYDSDNFYFQTRTLQGSKDNPIIVDRAGFEVEKSNEDYSSLTCNVRYEQRDWSEDLTVDFTDQKDRVIIPLPAETGRTFDLKITEIPDDVKIKRIWVSQVGFTPESRDE